MALNNLLKQFEEKTTLLIEAFKEEIFALRSSRPSSSQVENIKVECYGSQSLIKHLASISIVLPNIIIIEPWDQSLIPQIVKAVAASPLNVNPTVDGRQVKIFLPALTKERKEALVKILNSIKEEYRVRLRKQREEIISEIKKQYEEKVIPEDEKFRLLDEAQKIVEKTNKTLDEIAEKKEREILES